MSLKFGRTIRTLWLSQNYLVLIKKRVDHRHSNVTFCAVLIYPQNKADSRSNFEGYKNIFGCAGKK